MWYSLLKFAGTRSDYLRSLGVSNETIQWVETQDASAQNIYANSLRQNPSMSIQDLMVMPISKKKAPQEVYNSFEFSTSSQYNEFPAFSQWALIQIRKLRANSEGTEYLIDPTQIRNELNQIYDWYRYYLNNSGTDAQGQSRFQIAAYNWNSAKKMSDEWHAMMAGQGAGLMYEPIRSENIVYDFGDGHTIQLVTSENDLKAEGNKLNHCVGGYCESVIAGDAFIYSLRDEYNKPIATMELDKSGAVVQIKGHSNSEPPPEYDPYIREWVKSLPNPVWQDRTPLEYNLRNVDKSHIGSYLEDLAKDVDKYGLRRELDASYVFPDALIEDVLEKFLYSHDYNNDQYADRASEGLLDILVEYDKQQAEKHQHSNHGWYTFRFDSAYSVVDRIWDDYRGKYEKELLSDLKYDLPEPEMPHIDYRNYDNDEDFDADYDRAKEEYEQLHSEWKRNISELPSVIENHIEKWSKDDLKARFLKHLHDGLKKNVDSITRRMMKHQKQNSL